MIHLIRILCPMDYSSTSDNAVHYAIEFSKKVGAHVRFLHIPSSEATSADAAGSPVRPEDDLDARSKKFLQVLTAEKDNGLNADFLILNGDAPHVITEQALSWSADMIIMGFHGRTGRERLMMGSVSEEVFRGCDIPVLLVKKQLVDKIFVE